MRVTVVVLGDLSRSPRTVLHARALATAGHAVDLIGFAETGWSADVAGITTWTLPDAHSRSDASFLARATRRGIGLVSRLARLLWTVPRPDVILVQNPPGIPALALAWLAARSRGARLVIDWHNLTSSMLAMRVKDNHWLVRSTSIYEKCFGRRADGNLFVSSTMRTELARRWGLNGIVFYDQPAEIFRPLIADDRLAARTAVLQTLGATGASSFVVTSTSWTADEDFGLLLDALLQLDAAMTAEAHNEQEGARVVVLITGRGPMRADYEQRFAEAGFRSVRVCTAWLSAEAYPRTLAAADLGICLHRSSSGLDLPMKVLDMFGAGLPVVAFDYGACLRELVRPGTDGLLFKTSEELAAHLFTLLSPERPGAGSSLSVLRDGVANRTAPSWEQTWRTDVLPLLVRLGARGRR